MSRRSGFTLVELLLAAVIMAILTVGLSTHLRGGITVWRTTNRMTEALQRERIAMDRLGRDWANATLYDPRADAYGTEAGSLPEPYLGPNSMSWFTVEAPSRGGLPSVRMVTYECDARDGASGLWRTSRSLAEARARLGGTAVLLVPGCTQLSAQYASTPAGGTGSLEWSATWDDSPELLPALVDVGWQGEHVGRVRRIYVVPSGGGEIVAAEATEE